MEKPNVPASGAMKTPSGAAAPADAAPVVGATLPADAAPALEAMLPVGATPAVDATLPAGATPAVDATLPLEDAEPSPGGAGDAVPALDALTVTPESAGRYVFRGGRVAAELGRGGIGRVLVALDRHLGREIAVKELLVPTAGGSRSDAGGDGSGSAGRSTSPVAARFLREARVTGQLEHPNIVPVYELGEREDGTLYYAMKLVRGRTLAGALRECDGLAERLGLLAHYVDLCQAIAYAHSRGVIHRDIKAENVMLGEFGETVVLDWGLAKVRGQRDLGKRELEREIQLLPRGGADASQTVDGAALGTPAYMSPEQAQGRLEEIDEQSDVWSLGAVLYELLTGRPPHGGRTVAEVLRRVVEEPVRPVREVAADVPPELAAVAERALERDRSRRYASAQELAREVEAYQSGARVGAYSYSSWELLRRFVDRNRVLTGAAALLLVVLLVSVGLVTRGWRKAEVAREGQARARGRAEQARTMERGARLEAQQATRDAQRNLAAAYQEKADRLLAAHDHAGARVFAAAALLHHPGNPYGPHHSKADTRRDSRQDWSAIVAAQSTLFQAKMHGSLRAGPRLVGHGSEVWSVAWLPDGKRVVTASKDRTLRVWEVPSGKALATWKAPAPLMRVAVSPDGRQVAGATAVGTVILWDAASGQVLRTLAAHRGQVFAVEFSPRGGILASGGSDGLVKLWDAATGRAIAALRQGQPNVWALAFAPDGRTLATAAWGRETIIALWDVAGRRLRGELRGHRGPAWSVAFSPDGKLLASAGVDQSIRLWDVAAQRQTERLAHHHADVVQAVFSPDGTLLASVGVDRTVALYHVPSQAVVGRHVAHRHHIWSVAWSPDGRRLATGSWDGTAQLWSVEPLGRVRALVARDPYHLFLAYAPDGRQVYALSEMRVRIFSPERLQELGAFEGHRGEIRDLAVSRDGRWIATGAEDGTARIWDVATRQTRAVVRGHVGTVSAVALSADGRLLATGGADGGVRLHRVPAGTLLRVLHPGAKPGPGRVLDLAFAPDGRWLAWSTGDGKVTLSQVSDGKVLRQLTGRKAPSERLAVGGGGRWLAAAGDHKAITVWDTTTGRIHRRLRGHDTEVFMLNVSRDGTRLISGGRDKRVILWDLAAGRALLELKEDLVPMGVAFHPDGKSFGVSMAVPIYFYPVEDDLWRQDPRQLLETTQRDAGLRLRGFRLAVPAK